MLDKKKLWTCKISASGRETDIAQMYKRSPIINIQGCVALIYYLNMDVQEIFVSTDLAITWGNKRSVHYSLFFGKSMSK